MFCPKCGTQNPETGKFCRSCGADLGNVSAALSGNLKPAEPSYYIDHKGRTRSNDPDEIWSQAIRSFIMGFGFLIVSIVLFTTGVAGGRAWWWAMLFPAFSMMAVGISQWAKVNRMEKKRQNGETLSAPPPQFVQPQFPANQPNAALPPTNADYVRPPQNSIYDTGELVIQPSVTENTTRHLEINNEGETMTLPPPKK
jgi:hypothetical protein